MCIIIDNTNRDLFLKDPPNEDMQPIHEWFNRRGGKLVYSNGKKFSEFLSYRARMRLDDFASAGRAKLIPYSEVEKRLKKLNMGLLTSNDSHIIALALTAKVGLLCTQDGNLMDDFKNTKIMGKGNKGKIYSSAKNKDLLNRDTCP